MKIYTEVNYEFKDGSLVEQSSKFYNYDGQVAECKSSGQVAEEAKQELVKVHTKPWESPFVNPIAGLMSAGEKTKSLLEQSGISEAVREGPGGTSKEVVDAIYGGDTKNAFTSIQRTYRDAEGSVANFLNPLDRVSTAVNSLDITKLEEEEQTTDTTLEEQESLLTQGLIAEGGRKKKYGRDFMAGDPLSASILAP